MPAGSPAAITSRPAARGARRSGAPCSRRAGGECTRRRSRLPRPAPRPARAGRAGGRASHRLEELLDVVELTLDLGREQAVLDHSLDKREGCQNPGSRCGSVVFVDESAELVATIYDAEGSWVGSLRRVGWLEGTARGGGARGWSARCSCVAPVRGGGARGSACGVRKFGQPHRSPRFAGRWESANPAVSSTGIANPPCAAAVSSPYYLRTATGSSPTRPGDQRGLWGCQNSVRDERNQDLRAGR